MAKEKGQKLITSNRRARHDYTILDTYEAGIVLSGTEVKSLRTGRASLADAYADLHNGELRIHGIHIAEYENGTRTNHAPRRIRKLLLHRAELDKLAGKLTESGLTLVPLSMYFRDGWAKIELGLARGKREYDKRQTLAKRDADREIERALNRRAKGMRDLPQYGNARRESRRYASRARQFYRVADRFRSSSRYDRVMRAQDRSALEISSSLNRSALCKTENYIEGPIGFDSVR